VCDSAKKQRSPQSHEPKRAQFRQTRQGLSLWRCSGDLVVGGLAVGGEDGVSASIVVEVVLLPAGVLGNLGLVFGLVCAT